MRSAADAALLGVIAPGTVLRYRELLDLLVERGQSPGAAHLNITHSPLLVRVGWGRYRLREPATTANPTAAAATPSPNGPGAG